MSSSLCQETDPEGYRDRAKAEIIEVYLAFLYIFCYYSYNNSLRPLISMHTWGLSVFVDIIDYGNQ